jgi:hypothetical protein
MQLAEDNIGDKCPGPQPVTTGDDTVLGDVPGIPARGKIRPLNKDDSKEEHRLIQTIKDNYDRDPLARTVLASPENHKKFFRVSDGLIWTTNTRGVEVLCVP